MTSSFSHRISQLKIFCFTTLKSSLFRSTFINHPYLYIRNINNFKKIIHELSKCWCTGSCLTISKSYEAFFFSHDILVFETTLQITYFCSNRRTQGSLSNFDVQRLYRSDRGIEGTTRSPVLITSISFKSENSLVHLDFYIFKVFFKTNIR